MDVNITQFSESSSTTAASTQSITVHPNLYYANYVPEIEFIGKYVTLLTYTIGFPGNIFALIIWVQKKMLNSSGYYLAALACSDFLFLSLQVFHELNDTWGIRMLDYKFLCEFFPVIFLSTQFLSPLLVLAFTVERYISICHPFKREKFCTTKRARIVILCLAILCFCMNLIQGVYFYTFNEGSCGLREGAKNAWVVWTWFAEAVVFMLVPLMILFFNVLVIKEARRLAMFEKHQLKSHAKSHGNATTVMLIAVSFYHIFTTFPVTIVVALYVTYSVTNADSQMLVNSTMPYLHNNSTYNFIDAADLPQVWSSHFQYWFVKGIIEEIGLTHYAFNFYIYLITGKNFREEFRRIFCKGEDRKNSWNTEYTSVRTDPGNSQLTVRMQANGHTENKNNCKDTETPL